jgi:hypothetical protein
MRAYAYPHDAQADTANTPLRPCYEKVTTYGAEYPTTETSGSTSTQACLQGKNHWQRTAEQKRATRCWTLLPFVPPGYATMTGL